MREGLGVFFVWFFLASVLVWGFLLLLLGFGGWGFFQYLSCFSFLFSMLITAVRFFYMLDVSCFHCYSDTEVDTT